MENSIEKMGREDLVATILKMQEAMREQSKILTVLKNEIAERKAKKASTKKQKPIKRYALSNQDLDEIALYLEESVRKDGTKLSSGVLEDLQILWQEYIANPGHKAMLSFNRSELWGRLKLLKVEGLTWGDFSAICPAA